MITLEEMSHISKIVTAICAVMGLSVWKQTHIVISSIKNYIWNICRREWWLWKEQNSLTKYNRKLWNKYCDKYGNPDKNITFGTIDYLTNKNAYGKENREYLKFHTILPPEFFRNEKPSKPNNSLTSIEKSV